MDNRNPLKPDFRRVISLLLRMLTAFPCPNRTNSPGQMLGYLRKVKSPGPPFLRVPFSAKSEEKACFCYARSGYGVLKFLQETAKRPVFDVHVKQSHP